MPSNHSDIFLDAGDAAEARIAQITSFNYSANPALKMVKGSGGIGPKTNIVEGGEPQVSITTTDTSILELGTNTFLAKGYCATAAASVFPNNVFADCSTFNSSGVHTGISAPKVLAVPTTVTGTGSEAVQVNADLRLFGTSRIADPITALTSQALTVETFVQEHQFAEAYVKGVRLTEVTGFTFTAGFNVVRDKLGGFPTSFTIQGIESIIEINVENLAKAQAAIAANSTRVAGGVIIYLAKRNSEATISAYASTVHAKITALDATEQTGSITFSEGSNGSGTIRYSIINSNNANSGAFVTYATGIAIPT